MKIVRIDENGAGQRLDKFLMKYFNRAPKSFVYKMLRKKRIKLNGARAEGSEPLNAGDELSLYLAEETMASFMEAKEVPYAERRFGIIYEDEKALAVYKPAGLLSQPDDAAQRDTLIDQALFYLYEKGEYTPARDSVFAPALCNRLDRNTSGLVVIGKTPAAVRELNRASAEGKIKKYYLALVCGRPKASATLKGYILKDGASNSVRVYKTPRPGSKEIITKYRLLSEGRGCSMLEVELITGRSHQIRAHLASEGIYIAGDRKYGNRELNARLKSEFGLNNQFLHAYRMRIEAAGEETSGLLGREFICPLPRELENIRRTLNLEAYGEENLK